MKALLYLLALGLASPIMPSAARAALPTTPMQTISDEGQFLQYPAIKVKGLPDQRLTIWLPPGYDAGSGRYPVLYMHDGHNLFDPATSNFNKAWHADRAMRFLVNRGDIEPHIIVGIWAPGKDRYRQYLPMPIYAAASPALRAQMDRLAGGPIVSETYLNWITTQLKPWVDRRFRTRPEQQSTAIAGSSMGGLMSCYAFMARPQIFGRAACISSHWPSADPREVGPTNSDLQALLAHWFRTSLGGPEQRRLWMDHGTATLDATYAPYQRAVDAEVTAMGWQKGKDFESRVYEGAAHDENAWAARLQDILRWLLNTSATSPR